MGAGKMYNNPEAIKRISKKIVEKIGYSKLTDYGVSEQHIANLVRADIRPDDISEKRILDDVVCQLDHLCFRKKKF